LPENVFTHELSWSSSDDTILYIEEFTGQYVGLSKGNVTITATATDGSGVKGTAKVYVNEQTGIDEPYEKSNNSKVLYNLHGQQLTKPAKGISIINGKKIIIR